MDRKPILEGSFVVSLDETAVSNKIGSCYVELYDNEVSIFPKVTTWSTRDWLNWLWPSGNSDNNNNYCDKAKDASATTRRIFKQIDLKNVIGCRVSDKKNNADCPISLEIFSYPKSETNKGARYFQKLTLFCDSAEQSLETVIRWKQLISYLIRSSVADADKTLINDYISGKINELPVKKRKFLILLNPASGARQGEYLFEKCVSKMLKEAEIDCTLVKTEYSGHAKSFVAQHTNLFDYDGIVTASGDGLFYEVVNGLFSRSDWQKTFRIPLGLIPVGSGNSFSSMICFLTGEATHQNPVCQATFLLTKSLKPKPFDMIAVDTIDGRLYSCKFFAVGYARKKLGNFFNPPVVEKIEFIDKQRHFIATVVKGLQLREFERYFHRTFARTFLLTQRLNRDGFQPYAALMNTVLFFAWGLVADIDIESERLRYFGGTRFPIQTIIRILGLRTYRGRVSFLPVDNESNKSNSKIAEQESRSCSCVDTSLLPPLNEPVPTSWTTIDDEFVSVIATHCTHLSSYALLHPSIRLNDGCIWLVIHRASTTQRMSTFKLFYDMAQGYGIAKSEGSEWYRCRAIRIEPGPRTSASGHILTVDGERISYGPVQAQILPEAALLL